MRISPAFPARCPQPHNHLPSICTGCVRRPAGRVALDPYHCSLPVYNTTISWSNSACAWPKRSQSIDQPSMISLSPLQVVYGDLRDVIFERLYRFHVQVARLELVLQVRLGRFA